jgi:hypothetical protein
MAGVKPGLITGSNAKIVFGGKTLAYATDIQYSVDTAVIPVEVMGHFEVIANEPIAITVNGSFTVVRYAKGAAIASTATASATLPGAAASGNGIGALGGSTAAINQRDAFNPAGILATSTVDIAIFQKSLGGADGATATSTPVVKIIDCRLTRMSGSVNKRGVLTEAYAFVGRLMQDDDHTVGVSTDTDLT